MHKSSVLCLCLIVLSMIFLTPAGCTDSQTDSTGAPEKKADITGKISPGDEPLSAGSGETLLVMDVQGMTCQGCVDRISTHVAKLHDVHSVRVSLKQQTAWVIVEENKLDNAAIAAAVEKAGYSAAPAREVIPAQQTALKKKPEE